jgi:hypothetical protein
MNETIDEMIAAIEQRVCIRQIWRCNAGWGMLTIELERVDEYRKQMSDFYVRTANPPSRSARDLTLSEPPLEPAAIVQRYYPTLEECVRAEYRRWTS